MGETAENVAAHYKIARQAQDEFALQSHRRAVAAAESGALAAELIPVPLVELSAEKRKTDRAVERDEGPRADTSLEKLAALRPVFREGGTVTAGNSSSLNDGAAALLVASGAKARELGLTPFARIIASASAGVDPREMGMGPVPATRKVLTRAGLTVRDLDLVELNEAFAAQVLAVAQELQLNLDRLNVDGGAIAIGHPLGMSGARLLTHLVHALRARGGRYGLATLCVGVGQGLSMIVETIQD
jgi:acetyl-CoA acetyltransferase family protein